MEIELSDVTGLPDHLKAVVQTVDGKTKLNLATLVPASEVETWKGKVQTITAESIERRKALDMWKALGADPAEVQAKLAKGADPAIIDQMRAQMAEKETGFKAQLSKIVGERAASDLKAELAKAGVVPEGLELLAAVASRQIAIEDDGGIRILAADGKPMIGSGSNGGATLADLATALAAANPRLVADGGTGGTGRPANAGGGRSARVMTTAEFNNLSAKDRAKAMADGTTLKD